VKKKMQNLLHVKHIIDDATIIIHTGFEELTAVVTKSIISWDITLCSPLKASRRFVGTYSLHLQGIISQPRYQCKCRFIQP
jgi:hypothetical protein